MELALLLPIIVMLAMELLKRGSVAVSSLSPAKKQLTTVLITAALAACNALLGTDVPLDIALLTPEAVKEILVAALASMGLYTVTKARTAA